MLCVTQCPGGPKADPVHPRQPQAPDRSDQRPPRHRDRYAQHRADDITDAVIIRWVGSDERGRELEIIAIERTDCRLVIHVMPLHYRRNP